MTFWNKHINKMGRLKLEKVTVDQKLKDKGVRDRLPKRWAQSWQFL